jgi:hypothetical protein
MVLVSIKSNNQKTRAANGVNTIGSALAQI